jgi:hypothetical protein
VLLNFRCLVIVRTIKGLVIQRESSDLVVSS